MENAIILRYKDVVDAGFFELARKRVPIKNKKQKQSRIDKLLDIIKIAIRYREDNKYDDFLNLIIKFLPLIFSIFYEAKELTYFGDILKKDLYWLRNADSEEEKMCAILHLILDEFNSSLFYAYTHNTPYTLLAYLMYCTDSDLKIFKNRVFETKSRRSKNRG